MKYIPEKVCATQIDFEIIDGCVHNVNFQGGCKGNRQAVAILVEGLPVAVAIKKLRGIDCRFGTSCADQFAIALEKEQVNIK